MHGSIIPVAKYLIYYLEKHLKKKGYKLNEYGLYTQNKLVNLDDNSNDNSNENSNEDLIEHAEIIIAKIFNIAGMEYKDVSKRY